MVSQPQIPKIKIPPHVWGRAFWVAMHSVSFTYPDKPSRDDREHVISFLRNISHLLPCKACCAHFRNHLRTVDLEQVSSSRDSLVRFLVDIHNEVNVTAGKPTMTVDEVIEEYRREEGDQQCPVYATTTQTLMGHSCHVQPIFTISVVVTVSVVVFACLAWFKLSGHAKGRGGKASKRR